MSSFERIQGAVGVERQDATGHAPNRRLGYAAAILAAAFSGFIPVVGKRDLGALDPLLVAGATNLVAGLVLLPLAGRPRFQAVERRRVLAIALFGVVIAPAIYFTGLSRTSASEAAVLINGEAAFTLLLALAVLRERASRLDLAAVAAVLFGAVVVSTNLEFNMSGAHFIGNALVFFSTMFWALDNMVSTGLTRRNRPSSVAAWKNLSGAPLVVGIAIVVGADLAPLASAWPGLLIVGGLGIGVSLLLFYIGLRNIGAYRTSAIFGLQGAFGAVGGYALLGERLSVVQVAGATLMVSCVCLLAWSHRSADPPAALPGAVSVQTTKDMPPPP